MSDLNRLIELAAAGDVSPAAVIAVNYFVVERGPSSRDDIMAGLSMSRSSVTRVLTILFDGDLLTKSRAGRSAPTIYSSIRSASVVAVAETSVEVDAAPSDDEVPELVARLYQGFIGWTDPESPENGPADEFAAASYARRALCPGGDFESADSVLFQKLIVENLCSVVFGDRFSGSSWAPLTRNWKTFGATPFASCLEAISKLADLQLTKADRYPKYIATTVQNAARSVEVAR